MYLAINLIRVDERTGEVFLLAGEETEILFPMVAGGIYESTKFCSNDSQGTKSLYS